MRTVIIRGNAYVSLVQRNVRRCLPGDAMVHTKKGLLPIKDIEVGCEVLTSVGYEKVLNKFEQGLQQLVSIKTQDGDFKCTPNHRMAVCTSYNTYEWKEASELKQGDRLLSSRMILCGQQTSLPVWVYNKPEGSTTCKDITPPTLDTDMAWLIGLFQGGGYTYPNYDKNGFNAYVSIVTGLKGYTVALKEQLKRFDSNLHVSLKKNENSYMVHCQSKQLAWYFDKNIKQANTEIRVPEFIMKNTQEIRLAYLAGITDSDGCLKNRPINVVTTVYEQFARDIQNLLYACGMESRLEICSDNCPSRKECQRLHKVNLITKRSQKMFNEISELHKEMRITSRSQNANGFPTDFESNTRIKTKYGLYTNKQFNIDSYDREHGENWFAPVEVVNVTTSTIEDTFDIEVENQHAFFCNGYYTHNSAEIALGDVEDKTFINLKNYEENPERSEIGWMSNNSVVLSANSDFEDFSFIPDMATRIRDNGEPGMINLYNIQKYGRYGKVCPDKATLTNPCGEIALENFELCNLSEVFPIRCNNTTDFLEAMEYATFYSSTVSLLPTHRPETNAIIAKNRRIGVSISGIAQWASFGKDHTWGEMNYTRMTSILRNAYKVARKTNINLAIEAGVPASVRVTTVKPSGSISLLAGATPGVHYPVSRYAIRRMRIGKDSPLVPKLQEAGIPNEPDTYSDNTIVFEFVVDHGNVRPCTDVSPWEQFSLVAMLQRCYSDNAISSTIYFDKEKDGPDVEKMLAMFIPVLKSVSMLPHSGHGYKQAPYEPIDEETYNTRLSLYAKPKFDNVKGNVPEGSRFCSGDTCEL